MNMLIDSKTGLIPSIEYVPSPNKDQRPDCNDISTLVVHAISLPPDQFGGDYIRQLFTNCLDPEEHGYFREIHHLRVSAHFLVDRGGKITQFVSTHERAWHAGESCFNGRHGVNDFSIGVELEGCDGEKFTTRQYLQLANLTASIIRAYPKIVPERIVGHNEISPGRKTDPGPCFDWEHYRNLIKF